MDHQQIWAAGDFSLIGSSSLIVGELLCEAVDLRAAEQVLDVAAGAGNTTLAAARRGCDVTGIDFVHALLARARERAAAERLNLRLEAGRAEQLPYPDASFDVVLSTFGAMFSSAPEATGAELARVCKPGGRIGMANWTPDGFIGRFFHILDDYDEGRHGLAASTRWGTEAGIHELLGRHVRSVSTHRRQLKARSRSLQVWFEGMCKWFGPLKVIYESLPEAGRRECRQRLLDLAAGFNRSGDERLHARSEYLEVVAVR
jgi:ubiquinone/menaquinone biosynthesis C-methylase UbiE